MSRRTHRRCRRRIPTPTVRAPSGSAPLPRRISPWSRQVLPERPRRMRAVIDREEVLHVARLARLKLGEDEIEPLARELSAILDHVAHIGELDLDGVAPTTHVVEMTGALRADEPRE